VVHGPFCHHGVPARHRGRHILVRLQCFIPRLERHQPLPGAAGQHLRHHVLQCPEHLVAAAPEQQLVELDVRGKECLQVARLAQPAQFGAQGNELGTLRRARPAGGPGSGDGFDGDAQLGEAAVLFGTPLGGKAPPHELGIVDVPEIRLLHHDAHPAARVDQVHGFQDLHGVPGNRAGNAVFLLQPLKGQPAAGGQPGGGDGYADRLQDTLMHRGGGPAVVRVIRVLYCRRRHSFPPSRAGAQPQDSQEC
jgi:hypothetical protein